MYLLLLTLAAHAAPDPDDAVLRALSLRHDPPACSALAALLPDPGRTFAALTARDDTAPWVPLRAARCLFDHPAEAAPVVRAWMLDPELAGLADVALQHLHRLPAPLASELAALALAGPHAGLARKRLAAPAIEGLR